VFECTVLTVDSEDGTLDGLVPLPVSKKKEFRACSRHNFDS